MSKFELTNFWDFVRYLLVIIGTIIVTYLLWTRVDWLLAYFFVIPVFFVMQHVFGFLMLHLYFRTPEHKVASNAMNALHRGDIDAAFKILENYENCKSTSSDNDSEKTTAEAVAGKK